jgi:predicted nucleic acid-binding protein
LRRELERLSALEAERAKAAAVAATAEGTVATSVNVRAARGGKKGDSANRALVKSLMETENIELTDQEVARMLQEYQKELIRKGQTPLPIPLTPETDRQLVEEGLLPAQE